MVFNKFGPLIKKLANVSEITFTDEKINNAISFLIKSDEFFVTLSEELDIDAEIEKLQKDLDYQNGFKQSVLKKLDNEKFVANAKPEVIENEKKKLADAEAKIGALTMQLNGLRE